MRAIVRNLSSSATHLADVEETSAAVQFGATYRKPPASTRALCGVHIQNGVVMQEKTRVKCHACRYLAEQEQDRVEDSPIPLQEQIVREELAAAGWWGVPQHQIDGIADRIVQRLREIE